LPMGTFERLLPTAQKAERHDDVPREPDETCKGHTNSPACGLLVTIQLSVLIPSLFPATVGFRYLDVLSGWRLIGVAPNPHPSIPPRFCPAVSFRYCGFPPIIANCSRCLDLLRVP
jgi:hypothetical protein